MKTERTCVGPGPHALMGNHPAPIASLPAPPESTIDRIATLIDYGMALPRDAGDLRRAAEAVRELRRRVGELEAKVGELEALVDGREAERLIEAFANEFGG